MRIMDYSSCGLACLSTWRMNASIESNVLCVCSYETVPSRMYCQPRTESNILCYLPDCIYIHTSYIHFSSLAKHLSEDFLSIELKS